MTNGTGKASGTQQQCHPADHQNTIRDILVRDDNGTPGDPSDDEWVVGNHITYDAYGNVVSETDAAVDCLFGYTGRFFDEATGLQNNLNRWYDPAVGRWTSEDPIGFDGDIANLSRYCGNDPVNGVDPGGLEKSPPPMCIGSIPIPNLGTAFVNSDGSAMLDGIPGRIEFDGDVAKFIPDDPNIVFPTEPSMLELMIDGIGTLLGYKAGTTGTKLLSRWGDDAAKGIDKAADTAVHSVKVKKTAGLEKQIEKHKKKLDDYIKNPDLYDNKGFLKGVDQARRKKIIDSRIQNLKKQIENFESQINKHGD